MSNQITWGEWARVLKQMEQDQQRAQLISRNNEQLKAAMAAGMQSDFPGNAGYEGYGPMPTDAQNTVKIRTSTDNGTVDGTVTRPMPSRHGRSLMAALEAVNTAWRSDGRPHRFERPE